MFFPISQQYDSGGPLFYRGPDARLFVIAIVSKGDGCANDVSSINTRVTSYLKWIEGITGTLCRRS